MNILAVTATPSVESFNFAIARRAAAALESWGHTVWFHDLYREMEEPESSGGFSPLLPQAEIPRNGTIDSRAALHCEQLSRADGIIIVHPNWWGQPPAALKGWVDRVFRPGTAYEFEGLPGESGTVTGLLQGKFAVVFTTGDTDERREKEYFLDPLETLWKNCIFGFCGVEQFARRHFSVVMTSTADQRAAWLSEVEVLLKTFAGPERAQSVR